MSALAGIACGGCAAVLIGVVRCLAARRPVPAWLGEAGAAFGVAAILIHKFGLGWA